MTRVNNKGRVPNAFAGRTRLDRWPPSFAIRITRIALRARAFLPFSNCLRAGVGRFGARSWLAFYLLVGLLVSIAVVVVIIHLPVMRGICGESERTVFPDVMPSTVAVHVAAP